MKSTHFKAFRYIGDPLNAVRIFNDKKADELIFLDIMASKEGRCIDLELVRKLGDECNMPFTVGGGIGTIDQIRNLINAGAEKVCINSAALKRPAFISEAVEAFGSSTIVVVMDVKKRTFGGNRVYQARGGKASNWKPVDYAKHVESLGAGELMVNSIDMDGTMQGYDLDVIKEISSAVNIPVIACGGAGSFRHMQEAIDEGGASAAAAGSLFVYHGPRRAVLINLPELAELKRTFNRKAS